MTDLLAYFVDHDLPSYMREIGGLIGEEDLETEISAVSQFLKYRYKSGELYLILTNQLREYFHELDDYL